ncbi:unnamed protein product [Rotaria magnacalcarata]|uniref:Uncharacterized protein n=1 Tax=Rotaria magnacalcarata TaxID=392030 RepID=A0A816UTN5_9BILA|nr:unnamed protein product [Rotaria magnacalcarata]CAF4224096.1 unnamed protein product [Rotaria magnacalcarata]
MDDQHLEFDNVILPEFSAVAPILILAEDIHHNWLTKEIQKAHENREHAIIITHHAHCRHSTCSIDDEEAGVEDAFANDHDTDCMDPVRLWVHGHMHRSTNLMVNSTRLASNQFGYMSENCGFRPNLKIPLYDDGTANVTDA